MPPKKKDDKKDKQQEDESGIPKNYVNFKFSFEIKQNNIENYMIMFQWINSNDSALREKIDTDLIEGWTQPQADGKSNKYRINEKDPTFVTYEKTLESFRVDDAFAKNICGDKFYIYFVSIEDNKVKDTIYVHYSPLLFSTSNPQIEFFHDKLKIPEIESFKLTVTADKELLTPLFREYLNPLQVTIIGAKELPIDDTSYKYQPIYAQCKFFDNTVIRTHELPHNPTCKWMYKQVILAGLMDHVKLIETIKTKQLEIEIHDQDEIAKNDIKEFKTLINVKVEPEPVEEVIDPKKAGKPGAAKGKPAVDKDKEKEKEKAKKEEKAKQDKAKEKGKKDLKKKKDIKSFEPIFEEKKLDIISTNYGVANFNLADLLKPNVKSVKLRCFIAPIQTFKNNDFQNLDLNTTARKEIKRAHISSHYLESGSYLVVGFDLARELGPFKLPPPIQPPVEEVVVDKNAKDKKAAPVKKPEPVKEKEKPKPGAQKQPQPQPVVEQQPPAVILPPIDNKPRYERAVYLFPYKCPELVPMLLEAVQIINLEAFGRQGESHLYLTTKNLTEEEKNDPNLDIITGIEFIDNEYRTFILEGLAGRGMKRLEELYPRLEPNSEHIRIMKNIDIHFKERLYTQFNVDIRKIRLRENLSSLLLKPDIYLRSKVPEHLYNTLIIFNDLRKCNTMKEVEALNLFPTPENLLSLERKYGDALTEEDINGKEMPPKKTIKRTAMKLNPSEFSGPTVSLRPTQGKTEQKVTSQTVHSLRPSPEILEEHPTIETKTSSKAFLKVGTGSNTLKATVDNYKPEAYNLHMIKDYPVPEGQEVYNRSGHRLNIYEKQKEELREIVRNDPNYFYTYSAEYLSLSVDAYDPDEIKRREEALKKSMWKTPNGFHTILKKDKKDYITHPKKPHPSKIDELTHHPWWKDKVEQEKKLANDRGIPVKDPSRPDFRLNIHGVDYFSKPEILEVEKITAVEKEKELREERRREYEEWKKKLVVANPYFSVSMAGSKHSQLDKIKVVGLRDGEVQKKGLSLKDERLQKTTLPMDKDLKDAPISIYLEEPWREEAPNSCFERKLDKTKAVSDLDFTGYIKEAHQHTKIYKPMKNVFD